MVDTLRKFLLAGLGALDVTEEKAKAFFADLVARGELSEKDAKEMITSWSKRAAEQKERLQKDVEQAVHGALGKMGIARQTEIDALKAKIADLEAKLADKS
jgi:polyhydroxyalkanoate synthesis regulator phasin